MPQFVIYGRPTLHVYFAADNGTVLCVDPDGAVEVSDEDLMSLRSEDATTVASHPPLSEARRRAEAYASANQLALSDTFIYFD
jgi:hypothetical protein